MGNKIGGKYHSIDCCNLCPEDQSMRMVNLNRGNMSAYDERGLQDNVNIGDDEEEEEEEKEEEKEEYEAPLIDYTNKLFNITKSNYDVISLTLLRTMHLINCTLRANHLAANINI
uniref:Uncharacterized protein n=1 Tax=Glossina austeni TaxID=7395 RepID=A0A1A9V6Z3_GLOAU